MKTKELIKMLQELDPSGEVECCVGNTDIYFAEIQPAYYDGPLQVLIHDESKRGKCWSVVGGKLIRTSEAKIQIHTLSLYDAIFDTMLSGEDFPIEIIGDSDDDRCQRMVDKWREAAREIVGDGKNG